MWRSGGVYPTKSFTWGVHRDVARISCAHGSTDYDVISMLATSGPPTGSFVRQKKYGILILYLQ